MSWRSTRDWSCGKVSVADASNTSGITELMLSATVAPSLIHRKVAVDPTGHAPITLIQI